MQMVQAQQELEEKRSEILQMQIAAEAEKAELGLREQLMKEEAAAAQHAREMAKIEAETELSEMRVAAEGAKYSQQSAIEAQKAYTTELKSVADEQKTLQELEKIHEQRGKPRDGASN